MILGIDDQGQYEYHKIFTIFRGLSGQHQVLCYELKWIIYNHKMGAIIFLHRDKIVEFF